MRIVVLILVFFYGFMDAQSLAEIRGYLQKGESSEEVTKTLLTQSKSAFETTKMPIYKAYWAVGNFFMAKYSGNPITKYSYFKKGKKALEDAVSKDPNNLEIRLLRYISQEKTPKFLGYNQDLKSDKDFIIKNYKISNDEDLVRFIKKYLKL